MRAIRRLSRRLLPALAACAIMPPGAAAQSLDAAEPPLARRLHPDVP